MSVSRRETRRRDKRKDDGDVEYGGQQVTKDTQGWGAWSGKREARRGKRVVEGVRLRESGIEIAEAVGVGWGMSSLVSSSSSRVAE